MNCRFTNVFLDHYKCIRFWFLNWKKFPLLLRCVILWELQNKGSEGSPLWKTMVHDEVHAHDHLPQTIRSVSHKYLAGFLWCSDDQDHACCLLLWCKVEMFNKIYMEPSAIEITLTGSKNGTRGKLEIYQNYPRNIALIASRNLPLSVLSLLEEENITGISKFNHMLNNRDAMKTVHVKFKLASEWSEQPQQIFRLWHFAFIPHQLSTTTI